MSLPERLKALVEEVTNTLVKFEMTELSIEVSLHEETGTPKAKVTARHPLCDSLIYSREYNIPRDLDRIVENASTRLQRAVESCHQTISQSHQSIEAAKKQIADSKREAERITMLDPPLLDKLARALDEDEI
jgi:hypothetical protein